MWPALLDMNRDDCRRTLRRLELETYSNVINVFRAQGVLEESRKKILEDLRGVLHISNDRHSAEARRVANDELLATIAHHITGPNTELPWLMEGRRRIPLMPRGIPQTMYTELADQAMRDSLAEEKLRKETVKSGEEADVEESETGTADEAMEDDVDYVPVVMEDQSAKMLEEEYLKRKRKTTETSVKTTDDEGATPIKTIRNTSINTNQKHHDIALIYSNFNTKTSPAKMTHSYNQLGKVSNKTHTPRVRKQRVHKQKTPLPPKTPIKKDQQQPVQGKLSPNVNQIDYNAGTSTYLGSYIQSLQNQTINEEAKRKNTNDSMTMQMLLQPSNEVTVSDHIEQEPQHIQIPVNKPQIISNKPCQLVIRKKDIPEKTPTKPIHMVAKSDIKLVQHKQVVVAPNSQKYIGPQRVITSKNIMSKVSKPQATEKVIVTSTPNLMPKTVAKNIVIASSGALSQINKDQMSDVHKPDSFTPKNDIKATPTKTFVLNPKSGQKMVVVPAKTRKPMTDGHSVPVLLKGMPGTMKLVPVNSHNITPKTMNNITLVSKSQTTSINTQTQRIINLDQIKSPMYQNVQMTPKISNPALVRPPNKGLIVVQKGAPLAKSLTFSKSTPEVQKIVVTKTVNTVSTPNIVEKPKYNNIQITKMPEKPTEVVRVEQKIDKPVPMITEDTPIVFDCHVSDENNANSLDSTSESMTEPNEKVDLASNKESKESESNKDSSSINTDWEIDAEIENSTNVKVRNKMEIGISSDSETDTYLVKDVKSNDNYDSKKEAPVQMAGTMEETRDIFRSGSALSLPSRMLLSQLQDDGSSSNDSAFANLKPKLNCDDNKVTEETLEESNVSDTKPKHKQCSDIYSSGLASTNISISQFQYLGDEIMSGDNGNIEMQLSNLLGEAHSTETSSLSEKLPLAK